MTSRRPAPAASLAGARGRGHHSLAPAHLGEATAAATVGVVVGGIALVITGIGMLAMALTLGARYTADPPPNADLLRLVPLLLGLGVLALGAALTAGGIAVLGAVRRSRRVTGAVSALASGLSALGAVVVMVNPPPAPVVAVALTAATLLFGVAALLLVRPRR